MSASATISPAPSTATDDFSPFLTRTSAPEKPRGRLGFVLLLLAIAALVVRPSDLLPSLEHWPVYQSIMALCLACSVPRILYQLRADVRARALTLLLLGYGAMILASHLLHGNLYAASHNGFEFLKIILFYLVVVGWLDTVARLRVFLLAICGFTLVLTMLSVLSYDKLLDLPSLEAIRQADAHSEGGVVERLVGTGIFNDPNDLSLMLIVALGSCFCFALSTSSRWVKLGWWLPIGYFGYALLLTHSRGGFLALIAGAGTALALRIGFARTLLLAILTLPILFATLDGRQTQVDLSDPTDTFQTRLDKWSDALTLFKSSPLFGVGQDQQVEQVGQVAHNTYLQAFAELGIVGGACFLGMMWLSLRGVVRIDPARSDVVLAAFRPYVAGIIAGVGVGLLSLSRGYTISTYLVIALAAAFINLAPRERPLQLSATFLQHLMFMSLLLIVSAYLFVRTFGGPG